MRLLTLAVLISSVATLADDAPIPPPWGEGKKLREKMALEDARVCSDAKGRVVVIYRQDALYYGDARTLTAMNSDGSSVFDPRQHDDRALVS